MLDMMCVDQKGPGQARIANCKARIRNEILRVIKLVILRSQPAVKERGGWDLFHIAVPITRQHVYLQNIPRIFCSVE